MVKGGTVTSLGYNVVDVDLGTDAAHGESGWEPADGDTTFAALGITCSCWFVWFVVKDHWEQ